jgi:hypothetical protein
MRSGLVTTPAFADGKRSVKGGLLTAPHNYQLKPRTIWGVTGPAAGLLVGTVCYWTLNISAFGGKTDIPDRLADVR